MTTAWVVGRGGLLGRAFEQALRTDGTTIHVPSRRFRWDDAVAVAADLRDAAAGFAAAVEPGERWEIYWAAGVGTMGSVAATLVAESTALAALVDALQDLVASSSLSPSAGRVAYASSAGAIYAGASVADVIDERTDPAPTTAYARAKLAGEQAVRDMAERGGLRVLIARLSTLYGIGQTDTKAQGLLTHISRCLVTNRPVQIYVPLDTIRDYLSTDDAAAATIEALRSLDGPGATTKIVASERPVTISEIVSIFKRLSQRPPRIVTSAAPTTAVYSRQMRFRSIVPPLRGAPASPLPLGIARVLAAERMRYARGRVASGA